MPRMHMPNWCRRLWPYLGRRQADTDLREELRLHLELERERLQDAGVPEAEARRAAQRKLGNAPLIHERTRDVWGWRWLDDLGRDARHALRGLGRSPGFTAIVVCVLALGVGANTAMFSIVYGVMLRPLPYPDSEAIVHVGESFGGFRRGLGRPAMPLIRADAESFEQLAGYGTRDVEWADPDGAVTLRGATVSPSLFPMLRATPHLGRLFAEADGEAGAEGVALLSHRAWAARFASDPDIVGTVLTLDGATHSVIGVLAEGFHFPSPDEEIWTPEAIAPVPLPSRLRETVGRLRPGVSPERAATEVRTILDSSDDAGYAGYLVGLESAIAGSTGAPLIHDVHMTRWREEIAREYRPALLALTAAMVLVLLIACGNVAGLLFARGVTRRRTLAVCAALGAGRGRIVRQLLTESVVMSVLGGVMGLAAAAAVLRVVPALVPGDVARLDETGIDGVVLAFTLGLSVVVGLAFGAAPALQWSRLELVRTLNEGNGQSTGGFRLLRSGRTRAVLATAQMALALVLLVGAGLLLRSFVGLVTVDRGYDAANVLTARVRDPDVRPVRGRLGPAEAAERRAAGRRFAETLRAGMDRIERLPNVTAVGLSSALPLAAGGRTRMARMVGGPSRGNRPESLTWETQAASPDYFDVLRLRLRSGRVFNDLDGAGSPRVAVVNETFAREVLGGEPAVGQRVQLGFGGDSWEVIGVVADIRNRGLTGTRPVAEAFVPVRQLEAGPVADLAAPFIVVRTTGDPLAVVAFLREAVADAHPRAAVDDISTMNARLWAAVVQPRFYAVFAGGFAAFALFLAAFGVYGLLSYTVSQRRREIGVRMALGARRGDIVALVVRQGGALVAAGAVLGLLAAAASSRVLESFLYGVGTDDRLTFAAGPLVLVAAALAACWLPARRATRIDPVQALRVE